MDDPVWRHGTADLEVRLHYVEAGEGPLVVLLHGFPEFWYSWHRQIPALVDAGFHVVAPDMRGYNRSGKPDDLEAYRREALTSDIASLIDHFGADRAAVVGHDWGGVVSWLFAMDYPDRLDRLAVLNCPHPVEMARGMRDLRQMLRAFHMILFQAPVLPELLIRAADYGLVRYILRNDPVRDGAFSEADVDRYIEALDRPGSPTAPLNYYRAASNFGLIKPLETIDDPVFVLWGLHDRYLRADLAHPPADLVPNARMERFPAASHWLQMDRPGRVNAQLRRYLTADRSELV